MPRAAFASHACNATQGIGARGFSLKKCYIFLGAEILFLLADQLITAYLSSDNDVLDSFPPPRILIPHLPHGPQQVLWGKEFKEGRMGKERKVGKQSGGDNNLQRFGSQALFSWSIKFFSLEFY